MRQFWREWILPMGLLLIVVSPLKSAVLDWNWVPSGSMKPTIVEGDLVMVNKLAYDLKVPFTTTHLATWAHPARGDIAVFFSPQDGTRLVKRVVGLPGDTIELKNEVLYINGQAQRYAPLDPAPFMSDIFEDPTPNVAMEQLADRAHYVMALPHRGAMRSFGPVVVGEGKYFMLGDSRDNSYDSRYFGAVDRQAIVGRASYVLVSFDTSRYLWPRMRRFISPLERPGI
ncbi:MAG: signal peptidase I [Opitutae bacterium]|nr:signal peptidase I [Opitutae bacterium]